MFVTYSLVITNIESTVCVYMYMCTLLASCQIKGNFFFVVLHWYFHTRDILFSDLSYPESTGRSFTWGYFCVRIVIVMTHLLLFAKLRATSTSRPPLRPLGFSRS